jgi:hypothetical protein
MILESTKFRLGKENLAFDIDERRTALSPKIWSEYLPMQPCMVVCEFSVGWCHQT